MNRPAKLLCLLLVTAALRNEATTLPFGSSNSLEPAAIAARDYLADAKELLSAKDPAAAAELLRDALRRGEANADIYGVLGQTLLELDQLDEASHYLEQAVVLSGYDTKAAKQYRRSLKKADPLNSNREALLEKATSTLLTSAEKLFEAENLERALDLCVRIEPLAQGKQLSEVQDLLTKIRERNKAVSLDEAGADEEEDKQWPLFELESERYFLRANLEPEVVQLVGDTMDDIFKNYIQIYFGGDEGKVSKRKATIRIHPTYESMMGEWEGDSTPGGWWSPGEWRVVCYDTRAGFRGSLDGMLETLYHEASHQFMTMRAGGGSTPSWLNEGTASFFEGSKAMADHRVLWPQAATGRLVSLNSMLTRKSGPSLIDVLGYDEPGSYDPEYYPFGWGLVYFMQQYEDPESLEYVYRDLYLQYMQEITTRGGNPLELFEEVFLGDPSPNGFKELAEFDTFWTSWITETIFPINMGNDRSDLRKQKVAQYLDAVSNPPKKKSKRKKKKKKKKGELSREDELLTRALGELEFVRTEFDQDEFDDEMLVTMADVLTRLDRKKSVAPILEELLNRVDTGAMEMAEEDYEEYEKQLFTLDRKNAQLRDARGKSKRYAKAARKLLDSYEKQDSSYLLRSYTLARLAGLAFDDEELLPHSVALREQAREAGLLLGTIKEIDGRADEWTTVFDDRGDDFETSTGSASISGVRPTALICQNVPIRGEYELRFQLNRIGKIRRSTVNGAVISGTLDGDWVVVGIDGKGRLSIRRMVLSRGGGVTDKSLKAQFLDTDVAKDENPFVVVHAFPEGRLVITIGDREPFEYELDAPLPATAFAGIYAKDGQTELTDYIIEVYP